VAVNRCDRPTAARTTPHARALCDQLCCGRAQLSQDENWPQRGGRNSLEVINGTTCDRAFRRLPRPLRHRPRAAATRKHCGQARMSLGRIDLCCITGSDTMACNCAVCQEEDDHSDFWVGLTSFVSIHSKSSQVGGRWSVVGDRWSVVGAKRACWRRRGAGMFSFASFLLSLGVCDGHFETRVMAAAMTTAVMMTAVRHRAQ